MTKWTASDIVDQSGRTFVVTGANSGLGEVAARALGKAGAHVVLACRNTHKGEVVARSIGDNAEVRRLDLSDLASVREFAAGVDSVDVLVNNAGVMAVPQRKTADGFEMQIGTNHLGHFALTGLLLGKITDRVATMSSAAHQAGTIHLDDLNWERRKYNRWSAYGQSKLANLLFTYELQRRLAAAGSPVKAVAAHPGYASTNLQAHTESVQDKLMAVGNRIFAQSAEMGTLPMLFAATAPDVIGGSYIGPDGLFEQRGHPKVVGSNKKSRDEQTAKGLWSLSEDLTGVEYKFG
ncbi:MULTISPECIES: oxidoreductase [Rhodococcus]|uniref:SDR family NAD(P)-dependent oxidoreductase n=1 Tax=Rhodococcus pseudokoreensis TaxID=2811421 RepID=A0A974W425_9NOCA|nr:MULTISPECIES: oxidoreductase [Rhodococcus]MBV6758854.1 SDR family NAD(P)-dependent oxidoreductase [Rhodococcus opacus]QSE90287.1 SDR family NAD(P)-dependent oxidoreductase [Rhodococcus pseudokoreensis]